MKKTNKIERITPTCVLVVEINGKIFYAHLEDNPSAKAFVEKLNSEAITLDMRDSGNCEKTGTLPFELPKNEKPASIEPGDIILYNGNQIALCYGKNTPIFTRLAKIGNITNNNFIAALGNGDISIKISLEWGE